MAPCAALFLRILLQLDLPACRVFASFHRYTSRETDASGQLEVGLGPLMRGGYLRSALSTHLYYSMTFICDCAAYFVIVIASLRHSANSLSHRVGDFRVLSLKCFRTIKPTPVCL